MSHENNKKKKFDPLATDWLTGNVGKEEEKPEISKALIKKKQSINLNLLLLTTIAHEP